MLRLTVPRALRTPPRLDPTARVGPVRPRTALLINPFYPKDPHASFGKHVLTPTLALTTIAGATPPNWRVRYWDENLLQGPPPLRPAMPRIVGSSVANSRSSARTSAPESRLKSVDLPALV